MKRKLLVWMVCGILLLAGSTVSVADDYSVVPVQKGEQVQKDGNLVSDDYIRGVRELQIELDECREEVDEAPGQEAKSFVDGITWGALGGIILTVLFL